MDRTAASKDGIVEEGVATFTIESRVLRELGERLVKQPEIAIVELIKNAYDADATECRVEQAAPGGLVVVDDGTGMSLSSFLNGWMRIGTSSKEATAESPVFGRPITGEKGIGRFAVRVLGRSLTLRTVAYDDSRGCRTRLSAVFDWPAFDKHEDLGGIEVPYKLEVVDDSVETGTRLKIENLRAQTITLNLKEIRTGSIGLLSPLRALFGPSPTQPRRGVRGRLHDPGFKLILADEDDVAADVAASTLSSFVLRATLLVAKKTASLQVFRQGSADPLLDITEEIEVDLGNVRADIRFLPKRKGVFANAPVDGRIAYTWVADNGGIAVFDRHFRVQPYGSKGDDWLQLAADAARNRRAPRSSLALKHFPMSQNVQADTAENWMLRLPQPAQLVGVLQVAGQRGAGSRPGKEGLIASADREGFVANAAFEALTDLVRGAVEGIAFCDRQLQQQSAEAERQALLESIRAQTQQAIAEVNANPAIPKSEKARIVKSILQTQAAAEKHEDATRERERQLEVMSLLGVVAGFMTHEFGSALHDLTAASSAITELATRHGELEDSAASLARHIEHLTDFVDYSTGYISGTRRTPTVAYKVLPRVQQVLRVFGSYADDRGVDVNLSIAPDLWAPEVPASLYNGLALNLYTNALKAVTVRLGGELRRIAFRAWNDERRHYLEVSDTGIGIPAALRDRVFDPLFTTTDVDQSPLGSGMGLGLALVQRAARAYGGSASVVDPPPAFRTCLRIALPLKPSEG